VAYDAAAVLALFRVYAPEFASTADATVNALSSLLVDTVSVDAFGARTGEAIMRLAAHELTVQARDAGVTAGGRSAGPVMSVGTGDLSISYGALGAGTASTSEEDALRTTRHGLAYLRLRDSRAAVMPALIA
jgi:hypothetical protein